MGEDKLQNSIWGSIFGAFNFDSDDFLVNRSGYLSDRQKARLSIFISLHFISALFIFGLTIGVIWAYFAEIPYIPVLVCIIWSMVLAGIGIMWVISVNPLIKDYQENRVREVHGTISIKYIGGSGGGRGRTPGHFSIRAGGKSFDSLWFPHSHIIERQIYRIYYIPNSKIIVGLEEI